MNNNQLLEMAAFTINGRGGNKAGVVLDAADLPQLSNEMKQRIAKVAGYSETAFVLPSSTADLRLEFFTPTKQIDLCGHATLAALSALFPERFSDRAVVTYETTVGVQGATVNKNGVGLTFTGKFSTVKSDNILESEVADSLGTLNSDVIRNITLASAGNPFLLIEVPDTKILSSLYPNMQLISGISEELQIIGYYVYMKNAGGIIEARMFAPLFGIEEESATGMAAAALGFTLRNERSSWQILQGHLMARPSPASLNVEVSGDSIVVSGEAMTVAKHKIEL